MYISETTIRVRYSETDRMDFVYYGHYAQYFEVARVETLRNLGIIYKELEDNGTFLPVMEYNIQYLKPAKYDDQLLIRTTINQMPQARIRFDYEVINQEQVLIAKAHTVLVFLNKEHKPFRCPKEIQDKLRTYFNS